MAFLIGLFIIYAVFIVYQVHRILNKVVPAILKKQDPKMAPFNRLEAANWNHLEMYLCAVFLLPIRLVIVAGSLLLCTLACWVFTRGVDTKQPLSWLRRILISCFCSSCSRFLMLGAGFWHFDERRVRLWDFDPTYPKTKLLSNPNPERAPIIVSNHSSGFDILYHMAASAPGFVAKKEAKYYPCIGLIAGALQTLFVERSQSDERAGLINDLQERARYIKSHPWTPPLLFFAEGTTTNGSALLSFKKGAFLPGLPVKIVALKYNTEKFSPALDILGGYISFFLTMLQFSNSLTVYEFDTFYPDHLKLKGEEDWEKYANKARDIVSKCLEIPQTELGFRDKASYYAELRGEKRKAT